MTVTKVTAGFAVVLLGFLCWMAAAGFTALTALLVSGAVLVVLVAGGNWIGGRSTPRTRAVHAPEGGPIPTPAGSETPSVETPSVETPSVETPSVESATRQPEVGQVAGSAEAAHEAAGRPSAETPEPGRP